MIFVQEYEFFILKLEIIYYEMDGEILKVKRLNNKSNVIGANIKKYRLDAGITQEQLAVDIGKSYDFVRRLEFKKGEMR